MPPSVMISFSDSPRPWTARTMPKRAKLLARERWAGAVDVAGGHVLATVCAAMCHDSTVAACGLAASMFLAATVAPFILRGVTLAEVDSMMCPRPRRLEGWRRLARDRGLARLEAIATEIPQPRSSPRRAR